MKCERDLDVLWVDASHLEEDSSKENGISEEEADAFRREAWEKIKTADGVVVPGGFGNR